MPHINLTDSSLPPSDEEMEKLFLAEVEVLMGGANIDRFRIEGAPENLHYEWAPTNSASVARMQARGFKRNDELGRMNPHVNADTGNGAMIMDVACFSVPQWRHRLNRHALETAKVSRQDQRLSIAQAAQQASGGSPVGPGFSNLPKGNEDTMAIDRTTILKGQQVVDAVNSGT